MTYYEELGVPPAASVDEIREAYKQLARLLHPDKVQDEKSRVVAECQMKRLNALCETLTHIDRRHAYDQSLRQRDPGLVEPAPCIEEEGHQPKDWRYFLARLRGPDAAWIGAGLIGITLMTWMLADGTVRLARRTPLPPPLQEKHAVSHRPTPHWQGPVRPGEQLELQIAQLRRQVGEARDQRDSALAQAAAQELQIQDLKARGGSGLSAIMPQAPTPAPIVLAETRSQQAVGQPAAAHPNLAGSWYYARSQQARSGRDLYPPEFIEATINEQSGFLLGKYRARYRVVDRAISPEVEFRFSGQGAADTARLPWLGAGGARGEVWLKLITESTLEIAWIANDLGRSQGLGSGTAVLVRRREP